MGGTSMTGGGQKGTRGGAATTCGGHSGGPATTGGWNTTGTPNEMLTLTPARAERATATKVTAAIAINVLAFIPPFDGPRLESFRTRALK